MARIVVAGYIVRYPLAGNVWAHLQYPLGFAQLGHEVWFVEEAGWENSCYDPEQDVMTSDPRTGRQVLAALMARFGLSGRWAYHDWSGRWHGLPGEAVEAAIASADLFLDVGGTCRFPAMQQARRRAYVDMDPAFTQFGAFGLHAPFDAYDTLFSYGTAIGWPSCTVPTLGFHWHPLRPPVVLDIWEGAPPAPEGAPWTTVAHWSAYGACEYGGETYGQKDVEFMRMLPLPSLVAGPLELATARAEAPAALLEAAGWRLADPLAVSRDPWAYRDYLWRSRGEFSVAKNAYVKTRCGWFSDRTASYLAAGRPAVVQDTGGDLPTGQGLLTFRDLAEAAAALTAVEAGYRTHCCAARDLARTYFDARVVLGGLLATCGL